MSDLVGFIDEHRDEFGVELMCRSLQMAPSTYYAAKKRELAPSARAVRDAVLMQVLMVLWVTNRKVYGAHKLWKAAVRAGHDIGRDQTARLMRELGIEGISRRCKRIFATIADPDAVRAPDLVNRNFTAAMRVRSWKRSRLRSTKRQRGCGGSRHIPGSAACRHQQHDRNRPGFVGGSNS